jgi:hypothetical protein
LREEALLFLKKKKQKNFVHWCCRGGATELLWVKVFCFFFSKKKRLPSLSAGAGGVC